MATEEIFLFVNPTSGGNKGKEFIEAPQPFCTQLDDGRIAQLHVFSLPDKEKAEAGFRLLKAIADARGGPVRTVVGGGDGTVMWADSVATRCGVDTARQCLFGIIPLGTGNDFSRVAGWGGKNPKQILDNDCLVLRNMVRDWCQASVRPHDVWQVCLEVDGLEGQILKVSRGPKGAVEKEIDGEAKSLTCPMINYFSIGQESKVGIEFDKRRTKSQTCNLMVYACQGLCTEIDCQSRQLVGDLVASLHAGEDANGKVLFGYDEDHELPELTGNPESLMFLNVNSYAGGAGHFWQLDCDHAVDPEPDPKDVDVESHPGDGRLEVVTLPSIVNIALDRVAHDARRVHSGGPYYMEFFQPMDGKKHLDAYCEVDGEFYHMRNPESVTVTFLKRLQVLQKAPNPSGKEWAELLAESPKVIMESMQAAAKSIDGSVRTGVQSVKNAGKSVTSKLLAVGDSATRQARGVAHRG